LFEPQEVRIAKTIRTEISFAAFIIRVFG